MSDGAKSNRPVKAKSAEVKSEAVSPVAPADTAVKSKSGFSISLQDFTPVLLIVVILLLLVVLAKTRSIDSRVQKLEFLMKKLIDSYTD